MTQTIMFPHLGIQMESVGRAFSFFGFQLSYYGLLIGLAILLGTALTIYKAYQTRQSTDDYLLLSAIVVASGMAGARLFYIMFNLGLYKGHFGQIFSIRSGGMSFYGALAAGMVAAFMFSRYKKIRCRRILDTCSIGLAAGQVIAVWGHFFNREGFGQYTDGLFAMKLPIDAVRINDVTEQMKNHIDIIGEVRYIQVRPVFLLEFIAALIVLGILLYESRQKHKRGEIFFVYMIGFGVTHIFTEVAKVNKTTLFGTGVSANVFFAFMIALAGGALLVWTRSTSDHKRNGKRRSANTQRRVSKDMIIRR